MTPQRWNEVKALLAEALETPSERRAELLAAADPELARQVEDYLALDTQLGDFIERPAFDLHDDADPAVRVGEQLGSYRLAREIGSGGMGAVYQAVRADEEYEHSVAIKVLKRGLDTAEVIHRFRNERQILAGLEHPHVARLLDGGTTPDGRPYLVMEYVEGERIDVWCDERGLSVDERLELFLAVCEGVKFAHRNLVVHRDLKPSNILVTEDGTPKLLDFGIARLLDTEGPSLPTVGAWRFLTPEYASPEQVTGQPITTATDVYSLGVLLYQLLTDRRPYDLEDRSAKGLAALLERDVEPAKPSLVAPEERKKRLRGDLDNIALTALRKEPERRYGSAGELADDVRRHLDGLPVRATPDTWRYRAGKFVKRHRVGVAAAVVIGVLLVGFTATAIHLMQKEQMAREVAETERQRAEVENSRAQETLTFIEDLLIEADPDRAKGGDRTIRDLLDEATQELQPGGSGSSAIEDPFVRSQLLQTIGEAHLANGAVLDAQLALTECLQIREAILDGNDPAMAKTLGSLAQTYLQQKRLDEAERLLLRAIDIERNIQPENNPDLLAGLNNMARINFSKGRYDECVEIGKEGLVLRRQLEPQSQGVAASLHNIANCLIKLGRFREAKPYLVEAAELRKRLNVKASLTSSTLNSLANIHEAEGDLEAATSVYLEAIALLESYDESHTKLPSILNNLALLQLDADELSVAETNLRRAIAISDDDDPEDPDRWYFVRNLVDVLTRRGALTEAETLFSELSRAYRSDGYLDEWRMDDLRSLEAGLLVARGRFAEAEDEAVDSYQRLAAGGPSVNKRNLRQALERLIHLYEAWGKSGQAAYWRQELEAAEVQEVKAEA